MLHDVENFLLSAVKFFLNVPFEVLTIFSILSTLILNSLLLCSVILLKTVFTTLPTEICDHIAIYLTDIYDIESMKPYISNYIYKKLIKMT
jgi:hypothetical protein